MSDHVETMAWVREVPWHGLGKEVADNLSPAQMLKAAGLDWKVDKRPIYGKTQAGKFVPIPGKFGLTRDKDDKVLSIVGSTYKPVQNEEAFDFFKKFTHAGQMKMDTAGSLWGGRYTWALAKINSDFKLGKNDEVLSYLLLSSPHVHGRSLVMKYTSVRVVCWNTLSWALGADMTGKGGGEAGSFRMPHTQLFNEAMKETAMQALGLAKSQSQQFKEAATLLSKKKAKADDVESFFCEVLRFDPRKARKLSDGKSIVEPRMLPKFRQALEFAPGQELSTAKGTWWGALNAITYTIDHAVGRERDTALKGAWFGSNANVKATALKVALERAK